MRTLSADQKMGVLFALSTIVLLVLFFNNRAFFEWAFERHQNTWSWYIRPLFLIPFCYFSYQRSWAGIGATLFLLLTSMFWFPTPDIVDEQIKTFLAFEKQWLMQSWGVAPYVLSAFVPISLAALSAAIWHHNVMGGVLVLVIIALSKIAWGIYFAGESGISLIAPALFGLMICIVFIGLYVRRLKKNKVMER